MNKKIYISGPITDTNDDYKARFKKYEDSINKISGYEAINPAYTTLPTSAEHKDYMHVSFALIDLADAIMMTKCGCPLTCPICILSIFQLINIIVFNLVKNI